MESDVASNERAEVTTSLVTVTYNSADILRRCWGGAAIPSHVEWIVVDNGSTDDSIATARALGAIVIDAQRNRGFSAANNLGLRRARGRMVGFINPDVVVDFAGLVRLERVARENGALVAPQLLDLDGSDQPNGRGFPLLRSKVRHRLRGGDADYLLRSLDGQPRAVCWVMGAALLGERVTFEQLGGWDDHFFLYYEDKDVCLRAWTAGIPVLLVPDARWTHSWARETTSLRWAPWRREIASMVKFYARYPEFLLGTRASRRAHPEVADRVFGPSVA